MSTPHIEAKENQIAKTVLMPGDPLRAKFIAEKYLDDVVQFNTVRNMFGYTGTYKGHPVSVMGSGMGMPSIGIYSYELYNVYGVERIIRVGSAGAYTQETPLFATILASGAFSQSSYAKVAFGYEEEVLKPSESLNQRLLESAKKLNRTLHLGTIHSSDVFYNQKAEVFADKLKEHHALCVEMESFALFANARFLGKEAACLLTISDSLVTKEETTPQQRETSFTDMMEIALESLLLK